MLSRKLIYVCSNIYEIVEEEKAKEEVFKRNDDLVKIHQYQYKKKQKKHMNKKSQLIRLYSWAATREILPSVFPTK